MGLFLSLFCIIDLETSNGLMTAAGGLLMLSRLLIMPGVDHAVQINRVDCSCLLVLRPGGNMVLQGSHIINAPWMNALMHSTCSHKWWETVKGSIFGVKPSIPPTRGPGDDLVVAHAEKVSLLGSQFDRKQCHEQFVTPLSCFPQSRCNSLAFWTPVPFASAS